MVKNSLRSYWRPPDRFVDPVAVGINSDQQHIDVLLQGLQTAIAIGQNRGIKAVVDVLIDDDFLPWIFIDFGTLDREEFRGHARDDTRR